MSMKVIFNDWTLFSEDFEFEIFTNGKEVIVKETDTARTQLLDAKIEPSSICIYEVASYECSLEIEYHSKVINLIKSYYDEE